MRVLVTGASGFVGRRVCALLGAAGHEVIAATRVSTAPLAGASRVLALGELDALRDWRPALEGCEALVHLAARAHQGDEGAMRDEFFRINVAGTRALTEAALAAGLRRVVFVSSAKVYGESSPSAADGLSRAFVESDEPRPAGPYGESKLAAERLLAAGCAEAGAALTILRPPLVYGPGQKANLHALMSAISRGVPLPLASVRNARSLVYVEHLADAIACALRFESGMRLCNLADVDLSTPDLVRALAEGLGCRAPLLPCPVALLTLLGRLTGRGPAIDRLTGSFVLARSAASRLLGWQPRHSLAAAMRATAEAFRQSQA
jgi:nucleoside-diphosphate-sugar epimerase